jgi:hypothetical protein
MPRPHLVAVVPDLVVAVADFAAGGGIAMNFLQSSEVLPCLFRARVSLKMLRICYAIVNYHEMRGFLVL